MESGERLASPSSAQSSLHMASSSASSSPAPAPAPPQTPSAKCSPAPGPTSNSPLATCGHLFRMAGDQHFNMSGISSAFPLVGHPAFGLYAGNSGRSEFGGLGSLGVSAALVAHSQLGTFPEWWRASEAHARGAAAFFPPLLGLPPLFAPPFPSHDPAHFQSRTPSKNGRAPAKVSVGVNGLVNGGSISSSSVGNATENATPFPAKGTAEKTKATNGSSGNHNSSQDMGQVQQKTVQKMKEKKLNKKLVDTSSMSDSQSGSSSDSFSDGESSSDLDDLEAEEDDIDEDDDDQSNDTEDSDLEKESQGKRKIKGLTQTTAGRKETRPYAAEGSTTQDTKGPLARQLRDLIPPSSSYLCSSSSLPAALLFQSPRARGEEGKQHTSVIQATGLAASSKPLAVVSQSHRETSPAPHSPKPFTVASSPVHLPFSSSPKHFTPSVSPKHLSHSSSPRHNPLSSSPKPLSLCSSPKPLCLSSSPKPPSLSSSPKPPTLSPLHKTKSSSPLPPTLSPLHKPKSLASPPKHTRLVDGMKAGGRKFLDETSLHMSSFKLKQDSFNLAFPLPLTNQDSYKGHQKSAFSSSSLPPPKLSPEMPGSHMTPPPHSSHTNLFLNHHPNGIVHGAVQDAPLALITKPRSHSRTLSSKPLLAATSPPFPMPINLSTGTKEPTVCSATPSKASTSLDLAHRPGKNKTPKLVHCEKSRLKTTVSRPQVDLVKSTESDIPSSKDSDDSLGDDDDEDDEDNDEDSDGSLSEWESNLESDSDGSEDDMKGRDETETDTNAERVPPKPSKASLAFHSSSSSILDSCCPLNLQVIKPPSLPAFAMAEKSAALAFHSTTPSSSSSFPLVTPPGSGKRRRVTDERVLRLPLEFGWQRETRIRAVAGRLQGEVAYYAPCGKKLRQYPDVMKYLSRNGITEISRDNFSFSTKIKVGDFYEAREGPEGLQWFLLTEEEIIPSIIAMDGRRSRHTKPDYQQAGDGTGAKSRRHPPNVGETNVQDASDAKLLRKLEAQEIARQAAQIKMMRKLEKQAMVRAAKEARRQQAIMAAEERRKKKEQIKIFKQQEKIKRIQQIRMEKELRAQQILEAKRKKKEEAANAKILEAEKRSKEKELRRQQAVILKNQERERRRQHMMLMKAMEARKKAEEKERLKQEKKDEKRLNKERKLELRRLELEIAKELKKPNEDMCLADHKDLPELSRIPGLVLTGATFSDCLMILQFLRSFGKVLGFDVNVDVPNLSVLQEGLLNIGESMGQVQDLLVRMLSTAVCDPGLPPGHRAKTALGDHLTNVGINQENVSEILQIYMEAHCEQTELAELALSLKTKAFQAHTPSQKASMLAFLVNELCCSKAVVSEIDKNIDQMTNLRKDKWVIEGKFRKLRCIHAKRTGKRENSTGGEDSQTLGTPNAGRKRKRRDGDSEDDEDEDDDSEDQGDDDDEEEEDGGGGGKKGKKVETCEDEDDSDQTTTVEELEKQIEKTFKQQSQVRQKLFEMSHSLRSMMFGQDRYKRRYWVLPQCGGIFVEGMDTGEGSDELEKERERQRTFQAIQVKEELQEGEEKPVVVSPARSTDRDTATPESQQGNLFLQKPSSFSKLSTLLEVAKMSPDSDNSQNSYSAKIPVTAPSPSHLMAQTTLPCSSPAAPSQLALAAKLDTSALSLLGTPYLTSSQGITCSPQSTLSNDQLFRMLTEKSGHWFSLLPRSPCDESSVTSGSTTPAPSSSPQSSTTTRPKSPFSLSHSPLVRGSPSSSSGIHKQPLSAMQHVKSGVHQMGLPFFSWPSGVMSPNLPFPGSPLPPMLAPAYQHTEGNGNGNDNPFLGNGVTTSKCETPEPTCDKAPCGAQSPAVDVAKTQDHPCPQPIPEDMLCGWWRVSDMRELHALVKALHSRGIREKALQKTLQKHMEYMAQACARSRDVAVIDVAELEEQQVNEETVENWCVEEQAMEVDIGLLQQVEELERKVTSASLQVKGWMHPEPQSEREDLVYHEHKPFSSLGVEREASRDRQPGNVVRRPNNPLDIAVTRLAELERSIERRYLESPLSTTIQIRLDNVGTVTVPAPAPSTSRVGDGGEEDLAPGMRLWRKALGEVRSAAQLSLCIHQLQKSIAWERSIMKVYCQLCHKGDNEELLLLCDGCDKGCHTYCHKPKITTIPDGDWFCPACIAKASGQSPQSKKQQSRAAGGGKKGTEVKRNKKLSVLGELSEDDAATASPSTSISSTTSSSSSASSGMPKKGTKESKKRKGEESPPKNQHKQESPASSAKKAKTAKDNNAKDLAMCRLLLAELEAHQDAWPFLTPVNHKAVPGYKKVIKKPMDFSTIREKLVTNQYLNLETFIIDVNLVFDNCEKFNEDHSDVGRAGHSMRRFFEKRWTELLKLTL
ncbi:bromodomain adjacent to zinc finger domain protein 2B-like isoform X2 [Lampris incognitus]|uniref:bromodomain adjacent to zinc finger domain protein 2B-like isoform X2 n=1 Tax=Lampris incognitus TaxID=2546036 RepID=UPI0024B569EA|nr:bromodomain adjacent to zinc finger domain protein 2B-like isoform X2 [Lampris incognitus]